MVGNFTKRALFGLASVVAGTFYQGQALAQTSELEAFSASNESSRLALNYKPWNEFLTAFTVREDDRIAVFYEGIEDNGTTFLNGWLAYLRRVDPTTLSKRNQRTYWLNLHNTLVIDAISKQRRRRNLSKSRGTGDQPGDLWTEKRITVAGVRLSIDDIEEIVFTNFDDPLNFYGLYQGIKGGPALPSQALTPNTVEATLEKAAKDYLGSRSGFRGVRKDKARISGVYEWYVDDIFDGDTAALLDHVKRYASGRRARNLQNASTVDFQKVAYGADEYVVRVQQQLPAGGGGGASSGSGS